MDNDILKANDHRPMRVQFFLGSQGGGHLSAAYAMQAGLGKNIESRIEDVVDEKAPFPWNYLGRAYTALLLNCPNVYGMLWNATNGNMPFSQIPPAKPGA